MSDTAAGSQAFGIESPEASHGGPLRSPARYLVLIEPPDQSSALLFTAAREQVNEFAAGSEEVAVMTRGLNPEHTAAGSVWDAALAQYNAEERAAAAVYTLDI